MTHKHTMVFFTTAAIVLSACVSIRSAPDPKKVEAEIERYRQEERELVRSTIQDVQRVDRFLALVSQRDRMVSEQAQVIVAYRSKMSTLNTDYNAERDEFKEIIIEFNMAREQAQKQFVHLIESMKQETTEEEWKTISAFQVKRLNPRQLVYTRKHGED